MKTHALVAYVLASLSMTCVSAQITRLSDANFKGKLETLLKEQNVPVAAIGLIEDNKIVDTKIFGSYDPRDHPAENILFSIASLTKPVSMMLIMTLASNDKWNIDEPLSKYWIDPDIKEDSLSRKLTSRLLLSHQGGFNNWRSMSPGGKLSFVDPPGTSFRYSGEGYEYLRHAVERKFNTPFDVLTDSLLFKHFEMHHSYMIWPNHVDTLIYAGRFDENGKEYPIQRDSTSNAAASMITTIQDYTTFALACLNGKGISKKLNEQIHTPQIMVKERKDIGIGLSWIVVKNLKGGEYALMHSGSDPGIKTLVVLLPKSKRGLVVFTNADNGKKVYEQVLRDLLNVGDEILMRMNKSSKKEQ